MKLTVCLLASEAAPLSKTGGLADVSAALTKYLYSAGHDVRLFTPLYKSIDRTKLAPRPIEGLTDFEVSVGIHRYQFSLLLAQLPGTTAPVYLLDCPALFERATIIPSTPTSTCAFSPSRAPSSRPASVCRWAPQILHCKRLAHRLRAPCS